MYTMHLQAGSKNNGKCMFITQYSSTGYIGMAVVIQQCVYTLVDLLLTTISSKMKKWTYFNNGNVFLLPLVEFANVTNQNTYTYETW